jgi:hypothetical protein
MLLEQVFDYKLISQPGNKYRVWPLATRPGVQDQRRLPDASTFVRLFIAEHVDRARLHAALRPSIDRFAGLAEDEQRQRR